MRSPWEAFVTGAWSASGSAVRQLLSRSAASRSFWNPLLRRSSVFLQNFTKIQCIFAITRVNCGCVARGARRYKDARAETTLELTLVRHAQSEANERSKGLGHSGPTGHDPALTALGRAQARMLQLPPAEAPWQPSCTLHDCSYM